MLLDVPCSASSRSGSTASTLQQLPVLYSMLRCASVNDVGCASMPVDFAVGNNHLHDRRTLPMPLKKIKFRNKSVKCIVCVQKDAIISRIIGYKNFLLPS